MPHQDGQPLEGRQAIGEAGTPRPSPTASATPTARPSASPSPSTQSISSNATAIDFARIGILLLLQETRQLDDAANAQVQMQEFLRDDRDGDNNSNARVDLGAFEMDLIELSIQFQNGTKLQARPANST